VIETERLLLRPWREEDVAPFAAMGRDPEVMRYLGPLLSEDDSRHTFEVVAQQQRDRGFCFWAVERRSDGKFIGFCGLQVGSEPIAGEIEIGWRLARDAWGQGYATEAALASLAWGWDNLDAPSIAAITAALNERSWRLMERIGMRRYPDEDFDHPEVAPGQPDRPHVLYRIARPA
jgi:RimJ/RimL family protein N-acetyltransferase